MIRSHRFLVVAVRARDGAIVTDLEPVAPRSRWMRLPFIRGGWALYDSLALGLRAMRKSLEMVLPEEEKSVASPASFAMQSVLGLSVTVILLIVLPHLVATRLPAAATWQVSLLEGAVRLGIFLAFIYCLAFSEDIARLFRYHGAEHKAVHAYEHGRTDRVEDLIAFPPEHPRCGTAFLLIVLLVKIFLFALLPAGGVKGILMRLAMLPVVAAVSFEVLWLSAMVRSLWWLSLPGLWLQKLTTRQPTRDQLEVAWTAVQRILAAEGYPSATYGTIDKR